MRRLVDSAARLSPLQIEIGSVVETLADCSDFDFAGETDFGRKDASA
jgi:hypothetical protein